MKPIQHPVAFNNDYDDRVMRSGHGVSEPRTSQVNTYAPGLNDSTEPRVGQWQPTEKRAKHEYNDEAASSAATIAASHETNTMRKTALVTAEQVQIRQALGQPGGFSRSEEILVETESFRISRSSDGTVRNDLHNRPDLKAPVVQSPKRPSIGQTLTQEQIDQL